jgi:AtzE family amidohydrolase
MNVHSALSDALVTAAAIRQGEVTACAVTEAALARIAARDPAIHAFTGVFGARALASAERIDRMRSAGLVLPPLAGVPYAVKNLFDVDGVVTLAGARINGDDAPARGDATLVRRMEAAGAVLVGALNMDEYAYGFTTENTYFGATRNPHDVQRTAGGSSGGCGAAIAGGMVALTLGSDTNGSIRVPSSLCGVFGLKPTFGRLSRHGSYPFVYSLDHLGPFARSVSDLAACYDALQGPDAADPHCAQRPRQATLPVVSDDGRPLRVGMLGGYFQHNAGADAHRAVERAAAVLGAREVVEVPGVEQGRAAAFVTTASEGGQLHLPHLRERYADMEPLSRDRLLAGALLPAAWYLQAQRIRARYRQHFLRVLASFDVLLAAATPVTAPLLGTESIEVGGQTLPCRPSLGMLAQPISAIGLPVVAAPQWALSGLPIAVQLIAAPWREDLALLAARRLEAAGLHCANARQDA